MGEGLFPVRGDLPLDEAAFGVAFLSLLASFLLGAVAGPLVLDVADWAAAVISDSGVDGFSYAASAGCW